MDTLADRLERVLERAGCSARELSRRSGLAETQFGVTLARLRRNPESEVSVPIIKSIARGGKVSAAWLLTGQGSPDADDATRAPSTTESVVPHMANAVGFDDALAEAKRRRPDFTDEDWAAVGHASKYIVRGIVQPEELIELAQMRRKLANPDRLQAAWDAQRARIAELEAQIAAEAAAQKPKGRSPKRTKV